MNENALKTAISTLATSQQKRIAAIPNIGKEMKNVLDRKSKLPSKTRAVLVELADRYSMIKDTGAYL